MSPRKLDARSNFEESTGCVTPLPLEKARERYVLSADSPSRHSSRFLYPGQVLLVGATLGWITGLNKLSDVNDAAKLVKW